MTPALTAFLIVVVMVVLVVFGGLIAILERQAAADRRAAAGEDEEEAVEPPASEPSPPASAVPYSVVPYVAPVTPERQEQLDLQAAMQRAVDEKTGVLPISALPARWGADTPRGDGPLLEQRRLDRAGDPTVRAEAHPMSDDEVESRIQRQRRDAIVRSRERDRLARETAFEALSPARRAELGEEGVNAAVEQIAANVARMSVLPQAAVDAAPRGRSLPPDPDLARTFVRQTMAAANPGVPDVRVAIAAEAIVVTPGALEAYMIRAAFGLVPPLEPEPAPAPPEAGPAG